MKSWIEIPENSDFTLENIPFGIVSTAAGHYVATRIGDHVVNVCSLGRLGYFDDLSIPEDVLHKEFLNDFIGLGKERTNAVRLRIQNLFNAENNSLEENEKHRDKVLKEIDEVTLSMPVKVGDYTDFYSSEQHAFNVGVMFRGPENALMPNWKHMPVAYHGRASSVMVSGTPVKRPSGQQLNGEAEQPIFGPSKLLDFELEMAFIIGKNSGQGEQVNTEDAEEYIFGFCIMNDWSARDIQKWEYVPLGPFLGKNFASTISPWIITTEALEPFRTQGKYQSPAVLPYLQFQGDKHLNIDLEVYLETEDGSSTKLCHSNYKYLYWNIAQQLAHHTVNGCNINIGDMLASGTISGPDESEYGSMLELSWKGTKPIKLTNGEERKFLKDGDTIVMKAYGLKDGLRVGFGEVRNKIVPASN